MATQIPTKENILDSTINPVPPPRPRVAGDAPFDQLNAVIEPDGENPAADHQLAEERI